MLLTKLHIPPSGNNIVHRSKLFEKLNSGLSRKLILVSAPAGFGKTTVISDWIIHHKIPAVWLSIDIGDNDPAIWIQQTVIWISAIAYFYLTYVQDNKFLTRIINQYENNFSFDNDDDSDYRFILTKRRL